MLKQFKIADRCIIFIVSFILLAICSKSSFLYPINDWVDANCYFNTAKAVANGNILYNEVFWHGGVYCLIPYIIAYIINNTNFIGVYIIESILCAVVIYLIYKVYKLFDIKNSLSFSIITGALIYSSEAFQGGGGCTEEFALPIFLYTIYIGIKSIVDGKYLSNKKYFIVGIFSGVIFLTKYTLCIFFVAWYLIFFIDYLKNKDYRELTESIGSIILGILVSSIPAILYLIINNSFAEFFNQYFVYNLTDYSNSELSIGVKANKTMLLFVLYTLKNSIILALLLISALVKEKKLLKFYLSLLLIQMVFELIVGRWTYYLLPLNILIIFFVIFYKNILDKLKINYMIAMVISIALAFVLSPNTYFIDYDKSELPQYVFSDIINESDKKH